MKLETKHIAPYLPYNLQVEHKGETTTIDALVEKQKKYEKRRLKRDKDLPV